MSETTAAMIEMEHVTRRFGRMTAVNDLSLSIPRGSTFGFIGLNGAGKTTAIRMMVGLLAPHAGRIRVGGCLVPEERDKMKSRVGYVPDRPNVYGWMRVHEAIDFARTFYPSWSEARVTELLRLFDLDPTRRVKHLSKGMGAKLSLLLALAHDPEILILDEPMSGLDPLVRDEFLEGLIAALAQRGQTLFFSSHTLADVQRLADSVGLMHEGRLLFHKPVDALLSATRRVRVVLSDSAGPGATPPGVMWQQTTGREWMITLSDFSPSQLEFLRQKNAIANMEVMDMSLEDVFKDCLRGMRAKEGV